MLNCKSEEEKKIKNKSEEEKGRSGDISTGE